MNKEVIFTIPSISALLFENILPNKPMTLLFYFSPSKLGGLRFNTKTPQMLKTMIVTGKMAAIEWSFITRMADVAIIVRKPMLGLMPASDSTPAKIIPFIKQ